MQLLQKIFNKGIIPSIEQLYAYMSGRMTDSDKHQLEMTLIDEDFYSDALEGFELVKGQQDTTDKITEYLNEKIRHKSGIRNGRLSVLTNIDPKIYLMAASLAFLIGIGFVINHFIQSSEQVLTDNSMEQSASAPKEETFNEKNYKRMMAAKKNNQANIDSSEDVAKAAGEEEPATAILAQIIKKKPVAIPDTPRMTMATSNMASEKEKVDSFLGGITESKAEMTKAIPDQKEDAQAISQPVSSSGHESAAMKLVAKSATPPAASENTVAGQKESTVDEVPAYFPGGKEKLKQYIAANLKYPAKEKEARVSGVVKVGFVVDKKGSIKNVKVIQSVSEALDKEALKLVNNMPAWVPAQKLGEAVSSQQSLDIEFK